MEEKLFLKPISVRDAVAMAGKHRENVRFLAGGTDVMVNRFQENDSAEVLIDITGINELRGIRADGEYLLLGPLTTLREIEHDNEIKKHFPALAEAARAVASPLIRYSATLGGNILCENRCLFYNQSAWWREAVGYCLKCNGNICIATGGANACFSEFVSDTAPVLIVLCAEVEINTNGITEWKPLKDIYTGDGVKPRTLENHMLITGIRIPRTGSVHCVFKKLRLRESLDFTSLTSAVSIDKTGNLRIALAGMDPKPVCLEVKKETPVDEVIRQLLKMSRAVDNDVFTRIYRRNMLKVFIEESFNLLIK